MFSELPKLFDRNFAMAFLLPFVVFFWLAVEILYLFGLSINLISFVQVDLVVRTVIVFLVAWLGGILLLVTNQGGYTDFWKGMEIGIRFDSSRKLKRGDLSAWSTESPNLTANL